MSLNGRGQKVCKRQVARRRCGMSSEGQKVCFSRWLDGVEIELERAKGLGQVAWAGGMSLQAPGLKDKSSRVEDVGVRKTGDTGNRYAQ
jgi:hypothetical protein